MSRKILTASLVVANLFLLAVAAPTLVPSIDWWAIGAGGGRVTAGSAVLSGTVGQAVAGPNSAGSSALCAGFWCRPDPDAYSIYLPLILRNS
jgi:hypothetical protein